MVRATHSRELWLVMARARVRVRFFCNSICTVFRNFYVVCIVQMQNGNDGSIMVRVRAHNIMTSIT